MIAIHVNAGNDTNGNPRRLFVVFDDAGKMANYVPDARVMAVVSEGYRGSAALRDEYPDVPVAEIRLDITPKQYRELLRLGREIK